ncbi:MAG TPA: DUF4202 family protein [Desulfobacteraceae bacterium]|nr:DUF4202 family protein [Desulfobacteraceae bacterium]
MDRIRASEVPEDFGHALNTVKWVKRLAHEVSPLLEIAALGHDIERAMENVKVHREDFVDFDSFKKAHAENSANIVSEIMRECNWDEASIERVVGMIRNHETGGDRESNILRDADALSFFEVNLPYYYKRHDLAEVERRCRWGYLRLSRRSRPLLRNFRYPDEELNRLIERISASAVC